MSISARNVFVGKVSAVKQGPINAEVAITTAGGDIIVATLTESSALSLGLVIDKEAVAVVKAPWVTLVSGSSPWRFSARNQLQGHVSQIAAGAINSQVDIALPSGSKVHAIITNDAVAEMQLAAGVPVIALFKAVHVLVGVAA